MIQERVKMWWSEQRDEKWKRDQELQKLLKLTKVRKYLQVNGSLTDIRGLYKCTEILKFPEEPNLKAKILD